MSQYRWCLLVMSLGLPACIFGGPGDDDDQDDDDEGKDTAVPYAPTRKVLHEVFTGSTCGPCLEADENLDAVLEENPGRYTVMKYQVGSDPYISGESVSRRMFYLPDADNYSIPYCHADGVNGFHPNDMGDGEAYENEDFLAFAEVPAVLGIQPEFSVEGQTVDITVTLVPVEDVVSEDLRLMVAITENITYNNVGTNGQVEFHDVMKKMVPDEDGTEIESFEEGVPQVFDFSYTFQGEYNPDTSMQYPVDHDEEHTVEEFDDLNVIVWVQDVGTWEVLNSEWTGHEDH